MARRRRSRRVRPTRRVGRSASRRVMTPKRTVRTLQRKVLSRVRVNRRVLPRLGATLIKKTTNKKAGSMARRSRSRKPRGLRTAAERLRTGFATRKAARTERKAVRKDKRAAIWSGIKERRTARKDKRTALGKKILGVTGDMSRQLRTDIGNASSGIQSVAHSFGEGATEARQVYADKQKKLYLKLGIIGIALAVLAGLGLALKKKVGL